ncbi:MAG: hypothetical protein EA402_12805 [Planctomycetota bacterium]|nr:MAG: hypothetical protein EA402_12805 [Planctomycetota bacterium]
MHLYVTPIVLLVVSNVFMTMAWYGHLKFKDASIRNFHSIPRPLK